MIVAIGSIHREAAGIMRSSGYTAVKAPEDFAAYQPESEDYPTIVLSGSGSERAARAAKWAIQEFSPEAIVSFGFCAGTKNYAQSGDIVIAARVMELPGSPFEWSIVDETNSLGPDKTMLLASRTAVEISGLDFHHGTIVTIEKVATTSGAKKWLGDAVNATAADTASYAIAKIASAARIPWTVVCSVIDGRDFNSPKVVNRIGLGPNERGNMAYIKHLSSTPQDLLTLMRLSRSATSANSALNTFIREFMQAHSALTKSQQSATS